MKNNGKVFLVGSGPGDEKLLTVKAADVLARAGAVIYDNLINERILSRYCGGECELIYVGKSGSEHTMEQDDINRLIAETAKKHDIVVRLKGGDPFIFGRGGEEALFLAENGIEFEVVNGVSSAYAVPSYAGIPVTHRGLSSSVAFVTGHEDPRKEKSDISWEKLATGVQTIVFLMGVKNLNLIAEKLMAHGRDKTTPVAVIQNGTYPSQKTVTGTLETISSLASREGIAPPSVMVVGDVVSLREQITWFEKKPLFGKRILVTRSREQASLLVSKLEDHGAFVIELPAIKIMPVDSPTEVNACIRNIGSYDWIIFTSQNGVEHFFRHLKTGGHDSRWLHKNRICAIGPATAESLAEHGISADLVPKKYISTEAARELNELNEVKGKSFLLPRTNIASDTLKNDLLGSGARKVDDITVYRTEPDLSGNQAAVEGIFKKGIDLITFTSSSTAANLAELIRRTGIAFDYGTPCAAIGPVTAETAKLSGFRVSAVASEYTIDGLIDAVLGHFSIGITGSDA